MITIFHVSNRHGRNIVLTTVRPGEPIINEGLYLSEDAAPLSWIPVRRTAEYRELYRIMRLNH
jgi:hypothetical protein